MPTILFVSNYSNNNREGEAFETTCSKKTNNNESSIKGISFGVTLVLILSIFCIMISSKKETNKSMVVVIQWVEIMELSSGILDENDLMENNQM